MWLTLALARDGPPYCRGARHQTNFHLQITLSSMVRRWSMIQSNLSSMVRRWSEMDGSGWLCHQLGSVGEVLVGEGMFRFGSPKGDYLHHPPACIASTSPPQPKIGHSTTSAPRRDELFRAPAPLGVLRLDHLLRPPHELIRTPDAFGGQPGFLPAIHSCLYSSPHWRGHALRPKPPSPSSYRCTHNLPLHIFSEKCPLHPQDRSGAPAYGSNRRRDRENGGPRWRGEQPCCC